MTLKDDFIAAELARFIQNTNNLISINNGPFPNSALQYSAYLLYKLYEKKKTTANQCLALKY